MRATQTLIVNLDRLQNLGADANLIIRLMRAADDIALANWGLGHFREPRPRLEGHVQAGARRYFIRLQCGHLTEAMRLLQEVTTNARLQILLGRCGTNCRGAFRRLMDCLPGGSRRREFEEWIQSIRNRLAFHYDRSLVDRALAKRSSRRSTVTRGTDLVLWRFGVADDIEDTIVCRLLWKISSSADLRAEADRRAIFGSDLCRDYLEFCREFAFRYVREHAAC